MFNKKRKIVVLFFVPCISIIILLLYKKSNESSQLELISVLPDFELISYERERYSLKTQTKKDRTIVLFFSPDCELCEKEINDIIVNKEIFKEVRWLFITQSILEDELDIFLNNYPIMTIPNAVILLEDWPKYHTMFEVSGPPAMFVYDREGMLIHNVRGTVSIDVIKKWLQ